jgi:hypothetical protein
MTQQCKPWWHSKTIWLNTAVAAVAAVEASTEILKPIIPPDALGVVLAAVGILNVALRVATGQPVVKPKAPAPPAEPVAGE